MNQAAEPADMSSTSQFASSGALPLSPIAASPPMRGPSRARGDSGSYYEDVDPRFAVEENSAPPPALTPGGMTPGAISHGIPGGYPGTPGNGQRMQSPSAPPPPNPNTAYLHPAYLATAASGANGAAAGEAGANDVSPSSDQPHLSMNGTSPGPSSFNNVTPNGSSQEDLPEGARSPAQGSERASEASHFTSISQRPVNPNWRPGPGMGGPGSAYAGGPPPSSASAAQRRREDVILNGNPDFSLPGVGLGGRGGGRGGMMRGRGGGGVGGRGARGSVPPPTVGLTPGGRYPTDI